MNFSFEAWRDEHYIGLAELIVALGATALPLEWKLDLEEIAPHPQEGELRALEGSLVGTLRLLRACAPDVQIIDGSASAYSQDSGQPLVVLRAVDSTWWDVICLDEYSIKPLIESYQQSPDAVEVRDGREG